MLIAFEGIDGAGKGTQARLLYAHLLEEGYRVALLSFPRYGETVFARSVADYLTGAFGPLASIDPHLPALLYAGDRYESRSILADSLTYADVVLLDRYVASNLAHQGARVPEPERAEFIAWLCRIEHEVYGLPEPDLTLLLDVPVEYALPLIAAKGARSYTAGADLHEADPAYLAACRTVYQALAHAHTGSRRWVTLHHANDGQGMPPASDVAASIWALLTPTLAAVPRRQTHAMPPNA